MAKGIPITSTRGAQLIALAFAGALGLSAYFFATTGWGTPFPGCWPALSRTPALAVAAVQAALAFGFVIAALRVSSGTVLKDSLLVQMVLALFAALALGGGVYTLESGVARWGKSGCLKVGSPWSYGFGTFAIFVGAFALSLAAITAIRRGERELDS